MSFTTSGLNGIAKIDNFDMWNFGKEKHMTLHTKSLEGIPYISTLSLMSISFYQNSTSEKVISLEYLPDGDGINTHGKSQNSISFTEDQFTFLVDLIKLMMA